MNSLWIVYFVSIAVTVLFTALAKLLFTHDGGEEFNTSHIIILDLISAIPFVGTLEAFVIVCLLFISIFSGDLEPKYENEN